MFKANMEGGGVGGDAGRLVRQVREDLLLGAAVGRVVADHLDIEGRVPAAGHLPVEEPVVAAEAQETEATLIPQTGARVHEAA